MHPAPAESYTLSLHDALPISAGVVRASDERAITRSRSNTSPPSTIALEDGELSNMITAAVGWCAPPPRSGTSGRRSEEHTSELQSHSDLVCRLLLEKKKQKRK